jgi:hypothetical protein
MYGTVRAATRQRIEVWQRFAGKWATDAAGQKPCVLIDTATGNFKGFFGPFQRVTENYSFGPARNCPNGRSRFPLKNAVLSKWPIFPRIVAIYHVERSATVGPPNRIFALRTVEQKKAFTQRPGSALQSRRLPNVGGGVPGLAGESTVLTLTP